MKKKLMVLSLIVLFFSQLCNAQSYSENKKNYNKSNYYAMPGDSYNPALCGIASFFIPGLGQIIAGETGRGFAFLGGSALCFVGVGVGFVTQAVSINKAYYNHHSGSNPSMAGFCIMFTSIGAMVAVNLWSVFDAVGVAKVNNMYLRDLRKKNELSFEVAPFFDTVTYQNTGTLPVGLSFGLNF